MSEEVKNQTEGKEVASVNEDELAELLAQNQKLQEREVAEDGVKATYILLAKAGSKALKRSDKENYIEGLAQGDIYLHKEKKNLGASIKVVPLAFITLYNERENANQDSKFFGVWNKEQAMKYPVADGSYFNRQLPNGHILVPVNWVMVSVLGHHEIENAVVAFKSTGSRIWKKWKDDAKTRSGSCATLVYELKEAEYKNDSFEWTDFGFEFSANLLETDKNEAVYCLKLSNQIREAYEKHLLIADKVEEKASAPVALEDKSEVADSYDEDEDSGF
jgi:hypothetical protein